MGESGKALPEAIQELTEKKEKSLISYALRETGGNRTKAAKKLGISRKTLFNKMKQYGIRNERSV